MHLISGQNIALSATSLSIHLLNKNNTSQLTIDPSLFLLQSNDKIKQDADFVFFNNQNRPDVGIALNNNDFTVDLTKISADIVKLVFALTITDGVSRRQSFELVNEVSLLIRDTQTQQIIATFPLATAGMKETALIMGELYWRNGQWKVRALGKGFVGGLQPLAQLYGVTIGEGESHSVAQEVTTPPPAPAIETPPPKLSLSKINLSKKGDGISLEKKSKQHGEILINLNWTQGKKSLFGFSKAIDLDLGCLYELKDGSKLCVQALGNGFGSLNNPPYIALDGDDRTGQSVQGENLRINGANWDLIHRVLVYAFIYEGSPNWATANALISIKTPHQPTIEINLDSHDNSKTMCGIALFENQNGAIKITKLVDYKNGHQELDNAYQWGIRWQAGRK